MAYKEFVNSLYLYNWAKGIAITGETVVENNEFKSYSFLKYGMSLTRIHLKCFKA